MGTFQDPNPDRDWLKRGYTDTSSNPFSIDAQTEAMGRLAEGTGDTRMARIGRVVMKVAALLALLPFVVFAAQWALHLIG
ncbi:hypothetical protein [Actinoplanes rectilineatus]|uniref:hypothetical protein n=1 Tax=Actinoplanes rectilineatus TaxID=113571 RepID=UPI0005F2D481|nr:hypothetical protein [Actinoplanes rectilineatus]